MPFDHFSFIASLYNRNNEYSSLDLMIELAQLPTEGRLLDVGGGTGRVAFALRDKVVEVVVADPSRGMLHFAKSKPGIQVTAAASEHLPFPDGYFQRVIMVDALHHVLDQPETAHELLRVLEPGGRIVIEEPDIRTLGVKLVALIEKLLLMRSHFYSPEQIVSLFSTRKASVTSKDSTVWVVIEK